MTFYLKQTPGTETTRSRGEQARAEVERTVAQKWEDNYKEYMKNKEYIRCNDANC